MNSTAESHISFATDIKPLFRAKDQESMLRRFDLWEYSDVVEHADAILGALQSGQMPCDGAWPADQVQLFQDWVAGGKQS